MKLDYGTLLSNEPIKLSIGTIRKPTLRDIAKLTFPVFEQYESIIKLTPENLLSQISEENGKSIWDMIPDDQKKEITIYDILYENYELANEYIKMLQFFFIEQVDYSDGSFILLNDGVKRNMYHSIDEVRSVISFDDYRRIIYIIEQICCIDNKEDITTAKFKNSRAKKIFEKIQKGKKSAKNADFNYSIPNLISSVCAMHNSINLTNVWELTVFQLLDQFNRLSTNVVHNIESTRVSVWGDEKKKFDPSLWYKNEFDKK